MPEPFVIAEKTKPLLNPLSARRRRSTAQEPVRHDLAATAAVSGDRIPFGPAAFGRQVELFAAGALREPGLGRHQLPRWVTPRSYTGGAAQRRDGAWATEAIGQHRSPSRDNCSVGRR